MVMMRGSKCCVLAHSVSFDLSTEQKKVVKGKLIRAEIDNSNGRREGTGEKDQESKMIFFPFVLSGKISENQMLSR